MIFELDIDIWHAADTPWKASRLAYLSISQLCIGSMAIVRYKGLTILSMLFKIMAFEELTSTMEASNLHMNVKILFVTCCLIVFSTEIASSSVKLVSELAADELRYQMTNSTLCIRSASYSTA